MITVLGETEILQYAQLRDVGVLLVRGNNALLGLELAKASDVKSQRRLLDWMVD